MERKLLLPVDIRNPSKDTSKLKWLAAQTPAVIELSKDLYRQIRPFCTDKTCRKMTAGKYEYQWKHHPRSKKPRSYPAQYYLKMMFQWINQQKHIFEMESNRHDRLVKHMGEEDLDEPVLHSLFRKETLRILIADYLHDPFYYLTGIWAKAFSVYAHIFCQHFGNEELSPEVKSYVEASFERFMRFVKGYRILSTRRLAPLDKRIAKLDFKSLQIPTSPNVPRESKSVVMFNNNKTMSSQIRPSVMTTSLVRTEDSTSASPGVLRSESYDDVNKNKDKDKDKDKGDKEVGSPGGGGDRKETATSLQERKQDGEKDGYVSDPEAASGGEEEPGREDEYDFRNRAATKSSGGLDISVRLDRAESDVSIGRESPGDEPGGSKGKDNPA